MQVMMKVKTTAVLRDDDVSTHLCVASFWRRSQLHSDSEEEEQDGNET